MTGKALRLPVLPKEKILFPLTNLHALCGPYRNLEIPEKYEEDDTPRKFKELMSLLKPPSATAATSSTTSLGKKKGRSDDPWTVRPGEGFREYNARLIKAGCTVPPGTPKTLRDPLASPSSTADATSSRPPPKAAARPLKRYAEEDLKAPEGGTRKQRAAKLRRQKEQETKKRKREKAQDPDNSDYEVYEQRSLRDVVTAPPIFRSVPKETLKSKHRERPGQSKKRPSLLKDAKPPRKK